MFAGNKKKVSVSHIDYKIFGIVFFLYSSGFLFNEIMKLYSLFPIFTIIRIVLNLLLWFIAFYRKFEFNKNALLLLSSIGILSIYYLLICFREGKLLIGFETLRIYVEPLLFLFLIRVYCFNGLSRNMMLRLYVNVVLATAIISFITYILFLTNNLTSIVPEIPNTSFLPGLIFRSYLPIGCPNQQGLLMFTGIVLAYFSDFRSRKLLVFIFLISLLITFSKSAILACLLFYVMISMNNYRVFLKLFIVGVTIILALTFTIHLFEGSPIYEYFSNLFSGDDPSSNGHLNSLLEAIDKFQEYYLFGYPAGTVGSRVETIYNVESSFFILIYDKGLLFMVIYLCVVVMLLLDCMRNRIIGIYLFSIAMALSVLPIIQSLECFSLVLVSTLLLYGSYKIQSIHKVI